MSSGGVGAEPERTEYAAMTVVVTEESNRICPVCNGLGKLPPKLVVHSRKGIRKYKKHQDETLPIAEHKGQEWSVEQLEVAFDSRFTRAEVAEILGRSYAAVSSVKDRYRQDKKGNFYYIPPAERNKR